MFADADGAALFADTSALLSELKKVLISQLLFSLSLSLSLFVILKFVF